MKNSALFSQSTVANPWQFIREAFAGTKSKPIGPWPLMRNNISREDLDCLVEFLKQDDPILTQSKNVQAFEREWSVWLGVKPVPTLPARYNGCVTKDKCNTSRACGSRSSVRSASAPMSPGTGR